MATPVVESASSNIAASTTSVTITKPSGTVDGDLLVAILFASRSSSGTVADILDESGWTNMTEDVTATSRIKTIYKEASSEGSSYTFDTDASTDLYFGGTVFRISGWDGAAPTADGAVLSSATTTPSVTISVDPFVSNSLLLLGLNSSLGGGPIGVVSDYSISGTDPTWTEQYDETTSGRHQWISAYADAANGSEITSLSWTMTNANADSHVGVIVSVEGVENGDGTIASNTTNLTASIDSTGTSVANVATNNTNFTAQSVDSDPINPTVWTTTSKS